MKSTRVTFQIYSLVYLKIFLLLFFQELLFSKSISPIQMINLKKGFFAWLVDGATFQRVRGIKKYNGISSRHLWMPSRSKNFIGHE